MPPATDFDVVIIGGSFSGSSLGILLKRELPEARIAIVERAEKFDRKVGESTSEVAGCFLTQVLYLSTYLSRRHIVKNGLRMWFNSEENDCIARCSEIGGRLQTRLPAFQLDRSELDPYLLEQAEAVGCKVFRPATIRDLELKGAGRNRMTICSDQGNQTVSASWVADTSGKAALIARHRGTLRELEDHQTASVWARFRNVGDLDSRELASRFEDADGTILSARATATNHLMGYGWWCWIIPLKDGDVSAGVTFDKRIYELPEGPTQSARLQAHLLSHPVGRELFKDAEPIEKDTRTYGQLAYYSEEVAGDGWIIAGDASGFMDPLYSQGLDYCAHTVYRTHKVLTDALKGKNHSEQTRDYNRDFLESYHRWYASLYKNKYVYMGDAELMYAAFLLDLCLYFFGPVRFVYADKDGEFSRLPYQGKNGGRVAWFMRTYNRRLARIGQRRRAGGTYGKKNTDWRFTVRQGLAPGLPR